MASTVAPVDGAELFAHQQQLEDRAHLRRRGAAIAAAASSAAPAGELADRDRDGVPIVAVAGDPVAALLFAPLDAVQLVLRAAPGTHAGVRVCRMADGARLVQLGRDAADPAWGGVRMAQHDPKI